MAEVYLSLDSDMRNHLKVRKFCRLMQTKLAIAHLIDLWSAAITQAPDGDLSKIDPEDVEGMAGYDMGDLRCYRALVDCGFIDEVDENGQPCRRIHNWMKPGRTGYAMKKKAEAVENWRRTMNKGKDRARRDTPSTAESSADPQTTYSSPAGESPDDPLMTHGSPNDGPWGENPLHGSRFTVHESGSPSPPEISDPDRAPARVSLSHAITDPYRNGQKLVPVGLLTMPFMAVYRVYAAKVRGDARDDAALVWQERVAEHEAGEESLRDIVLAWFAKALKRHPYSGEIAKRPYLKSVLAGRRWQDDLSAPEDAQDQKPVDPYCDDHRKPGSRGRRARRYSEVCPECRHVAVLNRAPSNGEPTTTAALLARGGS